MMGEKISVIVPVYNVEAYLERCVESILHQTYTNFELILINDGSTDSSGKICDDLANQYENIKVYHIENAGVSNARNLGIQLATGAWITFIDSDDFVTNDYLATLASAVEGEHVGFVIAPLHHIKNGIVTDLPPHSGKTELWSTEETMKELLMTTRTSFFPVAKLFKRDLLADEKFNTNYHLAEDALFLTELLLKTRCSSVFIDKPIYYYDHREGSATTSVNRYVFDTIKVYMRIIAQVSQVFPNLKYELKNIDMVLIMTVNPGFGGQKFIPEMVQKIKDLREIDKNIDIEVDGGINNETAKLVKEAGANILVAGSYIFSGNYKEKIESLK